MLTVTLASISLPLTLPVSGTEDTVRSPPTRPMTSPPRRVAPAMVVSLPLLKRSWSPATRLAFCCRWLSRSNWPLPMSTLA